MFESLESRRLLSVSMTFSDGTKASASNGSLHVQSGGVNSRLNVVENRDALFSNGHFTVENNNTGERAEFDGITKDVDIVGGGGVNQIVFQSKTVPAHIATGAGADIIELRDESGAGGDKVETGGGNDIIILVYSHNSTLNGGGGDDVFAINTGSINNLGEDGGDTILFDYEGSNTVVDAGGGNDIFYIYDGNGKINGAGGSDTALDISNGDASFAYKNIEVDITI